MRTVMAPLVTSAVKRTTGSGLVIKRFITGREGDLAGSSGAFGKKEKALEEQFFRQLDAEKIKYLKDHPDVLKKEVKVHKEQQERIEAGAKAAKNKGMQ